jgi:hypothetical protein
LEPTSVHFIDRIIEVLEVRIAPALAGDPWAASELRSIEAVLALVGSRLQHQDGFLARDNDRLRRLLDDLAAPRGVGPDHSHLPGDPFALNLALRTALEERLPGLHDGRHPRELAAVRRCLLESTLDEEVLYGPLSERRPF